MDPRRQTSHSPDEGFSLIELLVVLVILGVLAMGIGTLGRKSPAAVKAGLLELRGVLQEARNLAMTSGQPVTMRFDATAQKVRYFQVNADGTLAANALAETSVQDAWSRLATITTAVPMVSGQTQDPAANPSIQLLFPVDGWTEPIEPTATVSFGFSNTGAPQKLSGTTTSPLINGMWVGVVGTTNNRIGPAYGMVLVNPLGVITAYYKADSKFDGLVEEKEFQWHRMD
jgi:prepilin-type N-terminal cleavage/methylation domain-containing protein